MHSRTLAEGIAEWDITQTADEAVHTFFKAGPAGIPSQVAFSQSTRWPSLDTDRAKGCIRSVDNAYSQEGGLAVLYGNIALDGCVVKTAGVDESILVFEGTAKIYESQDAAVKGILADEVKPGDVVIIRYEGPKGGPGMQEMLYPTSYLKSRVWASSAPCSPTVASPAAPRACRSATSRRKRQPAAPSAWSRTATRSSSTFPTAASTCWSVTSSSRPVACTRTTRAGNRCSRAHARSAPH